jgi:hypothetical protein
MQIHIAKNGQRMGPVTYTFTTTIARDRPGSFSSTDSLNQRSSFPRRFPTTTTYLFSKTAMGG